MIVARKKMRICIHQGNNEIGGWNIEVVSADGKRVIIDPGFAVGQIDNSKISQADSTFMEDIDPSLLAVIVSHLQLDHFGLIGQIPAKIPVIMGADARKILIRSAPFSPENYLIPSNGTNLKSEIPIELGPFRITPFLIDHSGNDLYSLLIEADGRTFFYSGDFRITSLNNKLTQRLLANPPSNIDVLMLRGPAPVEQEVALSSVERDPSAKLATAFESAGSHILMHTSSQTIDRIDSVLGACKKTGKRLVIDLYTSVVLEAAGNPLPQSEWPEIALYIPESQRNLIKSKKWFNLLKKHLKNRIFIGNLLAVPNNSVLLFRPLHLQDLEQTSILEHAIYLFFKWKEYWEYESYRHLQKWLKSHKIPMVSIEYGETSNLADLMNFAGRLTPARIVPLHPGMFECYQHAPDNIELHPYGEYWTV